MQPVHAQWRLRVAATRGFNIIEVMMATTILLVGFIGLIQAVTLGSESLDSARKQQVASQLIAAEIEKLRAGPWSRVSGIATSAAIATGPAGAVSGDMTNFGLTNYTTDPADDNTKLAGIARG